VTEPKTVAAQVEEVVPGVSSWCIHDERIDFLSCAHAVAGPEGVVLIDPLPLEPAALAKLGAVSAILLTAGTHQRSAWRYRRELGAPVFVPAQARLIEEEPDARYAEGDELPGGLQAYFTPGGGTTQHSFLLERDGGVLFTPDLLVHAPGEPPAFVAARYMHDPDEARRSVERILQLPFSVLCLDHGIPLVDDPKAAIRALLERS
jgi:glyoxylase-like metal-dependent hydrolase (beta-lactamase superfamily II)